MDTLTEQSAYAVAAQDVYARDDSRPVEIAVLGPRLLEEFARAEMDRRLTEDRWLSDLRQYRGVYDPDVLAKIGPTRSKAFVRKTRVKVKTVDSRVCDLLFPSGSEKNWDIGPTPKPHVSDEQLNQITQQLAQQAQLQAQALSQQAIQSGQPAPPVPPVTQENIEQAVQDFAKQAAQRMGTAIEDQLVEARYKQACVQAVHSGNLYGTGILKGPLIEKKVRTRFVFENGRWTARSEQYVVPFVDYVPVWRFYPDMGAANLSDCRYVYERHLMTTADLMDLAERASFDGALIRDYIKTHPKGEIRTRYIDNELKVIGQRQTNQGVLNGQYEVLERWGWLTGEDMQSVGVHVPDDRAHESFFANVWLLPNGQVIKAVLQPINGITWPYHLYYFDKDETSIFPEGLAAVMRDDQTMLNAATRMILDNGALTSGPMFEVTPQYLTSYEKLDEIAPWKVWVRNTQAPGAPAIRSVELNSNLGALSEIANRFENNTDETTAIPRYMSGENMAQGAAGTASGMSMLMGAANIVIKDLITAWDEGVTRPFLQAMYRWNMQFNPDNSIKGDFDVKARGASSLVAKEVRAKLLNEFSAMTANQLDAPFIKRDVLNRQRAEALEVGDVVKTADEVTREQQSGPAVQQQQIAEMQAQLSIAMQQAQVASLQADAAKKQADAERVKVEMALTAAKTVDIKVETVYAALQAAGVAVQNAGIAPAGDEILKSTGFVDATPSQPIGGIAPEAPAEGPIALSGTVNPKTGHRGALGGIQTARVN